MVVAVFGVTPALTKFGTTLLQSLLSRFYGSCSVLAASTCDEIKAFRSKAAAGVLYSEEPPEQLTIQFLLQEKIPIVALINTFSLATIELVSECGFPPLDAVRATSRWFSAMSEVVAARNVLVVRGKIGSKEFGQVAGKIASFLGLRASPVTEAGTAEHWYDIDLPSASSINPADGVHASAVSRLSPELQDYDHLLERGSNSRLRWPNSMFHLTDKEATPATDYIELTGAARLLVFGPYLGLPRGRWIAAPAISVDDNRSGNSIMIDISTNLGTELLANVQAKLPATGDYWCEIPFETPYCHLPIEVRLFLKQGAIEGKLRFNGVTLRRQ
jgi:hypothetical protein